MRIEIIRKLHPAIKEDVEKEKEKDKGITPPKAKENNPTVSKAKISNDASSSEHVDEETVKETEEVTILPPPPIKIETPIVDEVKQDDKLLELAIIKQLTRVIKEDLAELEKLEYEMMVIHDKEEKEYDTKEIEKLREELKIFLNKNGYETKTIVNFENTIEDALNEKADLILLDINLPYADGEYICKEIRKNSDVPIIMVTSRDSEIDELISLNYGADQYVTKPYNIRFA